MALNGLFEAEWYDPTLSPILLGVVLLAGVGTTALFLVSLVAYRRRRTVRYAVIAAALGALVLRTIVGFGTVFGVVPMVVHHLVEHGLDFCIAVLVLYAVSLGGTAGETSYARESDD